MTQKALEDMLRIDRTTMAALIDDLERTGFVIRQCHPRDRRAFLVWPTESGRTATTARALLKRLQRPPGRPGMPPRYRPGREDPAAPCGRQDGLMRVVVTRIEPDGTMQRRMVDTTGQGNRLQWEDLAARAIGVPVPYRPAPGIVVYHIKVDDYAVMAAEYDLNGPLLDLATAVMALGGEC